jgi:hypothetical protein
LLRTRWRSQSRSLGRGLINFDSAGRFPHGFLGFFSGVKLLVAFRFPAQDFKELTLAVAEGLLVDSSPEVQVESGTVRTRTSPLKPGMGEMKLSKAIQSLHSDRKSMRFLECNNIGKAKDALPGPFLTRYGRSALAHQSASWKYLGIFLPGDSLEALE